MARWNFMAGEQAGPVVSRLRLVRTPWFGVYIHHISGPDTDPDPHDHPWPFASLVLDGGYEQRVWPDKAEPHGYVTEQRGRWSLSFLPRKAAHMITRTDGALWTLVITGPRHRDGWGFWRNGQFIPWREYRKAHSGYR